MELARICEVVARYKFGKEFAEGLTVESLGKYISTFYRRNMSQENAGLSVNLVEEAVVRQGARIGKLQRVLNEQRVRRRLQLQRDLEIPEGGLRGGEGGEDGEGGGGEGQLGEHA